MTVTISAEERNVLYGELYAGLTGIDGVWLAASSGDYEEATQLARKFCEDLRLILDDLGWDEGGGESLELTTPPDVLRRILTRLRAAAENRRTMEEQERAALRSREEETQRLMDACERVLAATGGST